MSAPLRSPAGKGRPAILIVDDSPEVTAGLAAILRQRYPSVIESNSALRALELMRDVPVDLVISDISMPGMDGLALLSKVRETNPKAIVIMMTGYGSVETAVDAMKRGAYHYISKPFQAEEILLHVERGLQRLFLELEVEELRRRVTGQGAFDGLIVQSKKMLDVLDFIKKVAPTDAPVLIRGESGTGKELLARAIHRESERRRGQFLGINTAALPETLLEAELFGYKKGAFTGATADKEGLLTAAKGGTVFLDEISGMPHSSQAKLLRAIEEMEVLPVGGLDTVRIDARFVSATNSLTVSNLRQDLFYRLSVMEIRVPPLRERMEDVPLLATHFTEMYANRFGKGPKRLTPGAIEALTTYRWPGNVRELENTIQRAVVVSAEEGIYARDIHISGTEDTQAARILGAELPYEQAKVEALLAFQRSYVTSLLARANGNISKAAEAAGVTRGALYAIMRKLGMDEYGPRERRR